MLVLSVVACKILYLSDAVLLVSVEIVIVGFSKDIYRTCLAFSLFPILVIRNIIDTLHVLKQEISVRASSFNINSLALIHLDFICCGSVTL